MVQTTAPCACRAISPVSRVTWWLPQGKVFLRGFKRDLLAQIASLDHQLEEPAPRMKILDVGLEVLGEAVDALGQQRDLHLGRPGIVACPLMLLDHLRFLRYLQCHFASSPLLRRRF